MEVLEKPAYTKSAYKGRSLWILCVKVHVYISFQTNYACQSLSFIW